MPKRNNPGCATNPCCAAVATLTLTLKGCNNATLGAGISVTVTQGASSVTATTNGSGVATFSLPATGTWGWSQSGAPTGYAATGSPATFAILAGANAKTVAVSADAASGYFCDGCGTPVTSLTAVFGPAVGGSATTTVTLVAGFGVAGGWFAAAQPGGGSVTWHRVVGAPSLSVPSTGFGYQDSGVLATAPMPAATYAGGSTQNWGSFSVGQCSPYSLGYSDASFGATYTH